MKDLCACMLIVLLAFILYSSIIMPIRVKLCETQNMTAVWYLNGCVIKEK
jgi:hypothetical protein